MLHKCYCGIDYECPWCGTPEGFICPTVNCDEDAYMCDACIEKFAADYQKAFDEEAEKVALSESVERNFNDV